MKFRLVTSLFATAVLLGAGLGQTAEREFRLALLHTIFAEYLLSGGNHWLDRAGIERL